MANLFLNVYRNKIWFKNEKLKSHKVKVVGKFCSIDGLDTCKLDMLQSSILEIKNTWIEFEYSFFNNTYYADVVVTFHNDEPTEEDLEINRNVILKCEDFLRSNNSKDIDESINNGNKFVEIADEDGFIIELQDNDDEGCLDKTELEQVFYDNKIGFKPMSISILNSNNGMKCQREKLFYFIKSGGEPRVTYDVLKKILIEKSNIPIDSIMLNDMKKYDFCKLREIISQRIGDHDKAIVLTKAYDNDDMFHMEFRAYNNKICLTCDENYQVIDFELLNDGL